MLPRSVLPAAQLDSNSEEILTMRKTITWAVILATLGAYLYVRLVVLGPPLEPGKPAPEITGEDLDGVPMKLSDFRGKVVVLDFWGNW